MSLSDLYRDYNDQVKFAVIYIREAHPLDGWQYGDISTVHDPKTIEERRKLASQCDSAMKHGIKTYVDKMDNEVMIQYCAYPERLYLIKTDGTVAYPGAPGPSGFSPKELKEAIDKVLKEEGKQVQPGKADSGKADSGNQK